MGGKLGLVTKNTDVRVSDSRIVFGTKRRGSNRRMEKIAY
jgi:hypothetical protein